MTRHDRIALRTVAILVAACVGTMLAQVALCAPLRTPAAVVDCSRMVTAYDHRAADTPTAVRVCVDAELSARKHGAPKGLGVAVASVESHFDPAAISYAGAFGPLQVLPRYHSPRIGLGWANPYRHAVERGGWYLARLVRRYGVTDGVASYNCGPSRWRSQRVESCERYARKVGRRFALLRGRG